MDKEWFFEKGKVVDLAVCSSALSEPPIEKAAEGILDTYRVKKAGILFFADYVKDF